jgi:predicted ArsR family transcriptional regulator
MRSPEDVAAIAALRDPLRAAVYELVAAREAPVTRDVVADALAVPRSTAAFQLDRLAASGLLDVSYAKPEGRRGPGSGRPAKLYARAPREIGVTVPDRHYDLMGSLLASAIETAARTGEPVLDALRASARDAGRTAGADAGSLHAVLADGGYEAQPEPGGDIALHNCPFHRLAAEHTDVVCGANHAYLCGAAEATGADPDLVVLAPQAGRCCVRLSDPGEARDRDEDR